jgi:hypothetical protein
VEIKIMKNELHLSGLLNEETNFEQLTSAMRLAAGAASNQEVIANFEKVTRCNSIGILTWLRAINKATHRIIYRNCPVFLTEQFASVSQLVGKNCSVESFYARYHCTESDEFMVHKLHVGTDVPVLPDYTDFEIPNLVIQGKIFEPDFIPSDYLSFLASGAGEN